jgi:uncharacterized protein
VAVVNDALLALAELDTELVPARHAVGHPPSLQLHDDALAELRVLRTRKRELDVEREPLAVRSEALERDAATARERAAAIADRLDASTGAGRELEAMAHERDALVARAAKLEDDLLEVLELLEPLDARDVVLHERATEVSAARERLALAVGNERTAATARLEALEASRPGLGAAVEPALYERYERIAARAGGIGAARLVDGRCGACRVTVPSVIADHLEHATGDGVVEVCDECGRLLVA